MGDVGILHVDDDQGFAQLTAELLERKDDRFTVETATSAAEGLQSLDGSLPDCIVSDFEMPEMDGLEFLRAVREKHSKLPFILFTGRGSEAVASDAISAGATDYLQKQSGTEQYELLANRIDNVVAQYRSEKQLQETKEEYAAVFENTRNGLLLVDVEEGGFRFRRCNSRVLEFTGLAESELIGKTPLEALGYENGRAVAGAYRKCVATRETIEYTVTLTHPVGEVVHVVSATPIIQDDEVEQLVIAFTDITERHNREQELLEERTVMQHALDALEDPLFVIGAEGRVEHCNERAGAVTGHTGQAAEGMLLTDLFPEAEREAITDAVDRSISHGRATVTADLRTDDGHRRTYEFHGRCLTDLDGNTAGVVMIGQTLSDD
ncbi:PAS domain S-box protein [Haloarcula sp. CBA1130]|uniref:PAS domain-containing response regulator n=1 Tax=unclassified Haloarcula TaxID=2624677 RepID=UPI001245B062|nr:MULTISPECIES: PAS domain-containing protein [unclassified Haloarcula]KAA9397923.1 PAS domain S-box protein [Haloarcula sp. CBA1129]KAA9402388.1 PAS domain S-box protein [Haloarcula sp. CBA1130]